MPDCCPLCGSDNVDDYEEDIKQCRDCQLCYIPERWKMFTKDKREEKE
jgi:ribosomal protein L37AE/L43A